MSRSLRQVPNLISAIRILLVAPIAVALARHQPVTAIGLFGVAAFSDAADGYLAKRFDWRTELGAVLDPVADKVLLATVFIMLAYLQLVPLWLMFAAVARDVVIVAGALLFRYCIGPLEVRPSVVSKLNTLCQAAFILAVVGREAASVPPAWVVLWLGALVFVTVAISGIDYVLIYGRRALNQSKPRAAARAGDARVKQLALGVRLRADAVFESFWPGQNAEIVAALKMPGTTPLWLWGASATGKTHLLQAVCAAAGDAAAYFPLDRSLALPPEALAGFERTRVLCVDDADVVAGDLAWERALFRLFNDAAELRTRLIFAATAPPRQPAWALEDWRSRAAACVVYQLRELDDEGRIEALRLRAAQRGLQLPHETSEYLLKRLPRDLRSLFGILDQLDEASLAAQRRLTIPFIRDALEKHAGTKS